MNASKRLTEITELFSKGDWDSILEKYLKSGKEMRQTQSSEKRSENRNVLYYLLATCMECGFYCDYLDILKRYYMVAEESFFKHKPDTLRIISNFALESLLYCLYNNAEENLGIEYDIPEHIERVLNFRNQLNKEIGNHQDQRWSELIALYDDYKNGRMPIYVVEYLYPFEPMIKDYIFDLSQCPPYMSLAVKQMPRDIDNYTSFTFRVKGLIKPDTWWRGPRWEYRTKMPPIKKTLSILNMLLLQAVKASPGKMVLPYSIEQVSTASMFQYRYDEKETVLGGTIIGTDFRAQFVGGNTKWHEFTEDELLLLNQIIVSKYGSRPFVTTFHHAMNLQSGGFYLESFLLLCASCEGMAYYWCEEISKICGIESKYLTYSQTKISKCDSCSLFLESKGKGEKPYNGMVPSLFDNFSFLEKQKCITSKERKQLGKYLAKARHDDLRNHITHGMENAISKKEVNESLEAVFGLQEEFQKIIDRLTKIKEY